MTVRPRRSARPFLALLLGGLLSWGESAPAWAQRVLVTPSLTLQEEHDDNVRRSSTDRESDFVTTLTPGLRLEVQNYPWNLTLVGSLRGEFFATQSELNNFGDNSSATASVEYRPRPTLTLSLTDTFARSLNPADIDPVTGVTTTGRSVSTSNTFGPALRYQTAPRTSLGLRYSLRTLRSDTEAAQNSDTHVAEFSVERQVPPRDTATFRYTYTHFRVEGEPSLDTHLPRLGLVHAFSPTIRVTAEAGPLFLQSEDRSEVTLGGTLRYDQQFRTGSLSVALDRSSELAGRIGTAGVSQSLTTVTTFPLAPNLTFALNSAIRETESAGALGDLLVMTNEVAITYQPTRALTLGVQGSVSDNQSSNDTVDFRTYSAGIQFTYRLLRWLSLQGGYRLERQDDRVGSDDLRRNLFFLGLTTSEQFRLY